MRFGLSLLLFLTFLHAEPIKPIPLNPEYDKAKAQLGKQLFFDTILSKDYTIACVNCHFLPGSGADVSAVSIGVNGSKGDVNSPTVLNAVYNFSQFWDGRAKDLQDQAKGPIPNKIEMALPLSEAVERLKENKTYKANFKALYKDGVTVDNLTDAIAEFEKALTTPNSRFDQYLRGDTTALNDLELKGYTLFKEKGCVSCHNGVNIGGNLYQKSGIFSKELEIHPEHLGRFSVTKKEKDKYYFKVPTLRNIAKTAPYFHDGTTTTLKDAVEKMMQFQLGIIPVDSDVNALVAFLRTLDGDTPAIMKE